MELGEDDRAGLPDAFVAAAKATPKSGAWQARRS